MKKRVITGMLVALCSGVTLADVEKHTHPHPGPVASQSFGVTIPQNMWDHVEIGFLTEMEAFASKVGDVDESDVALATVELTLGAGISKGIHGYVGLLWEEDDTEEKNLDEAYIKFGAIESIPFYLTVGKMYLPFGNFESAFISDPLTLELAEIRESAVMVGYACGWLDINAGAFSGDLEEEGDDTIDNGFVSITCTPSETFSFGVYGLADMLETDGLFDFVESAFPVPGIRDRYAGAGAFLCATIGSVAVNAEYVAMLDRLDVPGADLRPQAWNLEASMSVHHQVSIGIKVESSEEFYSEVGIGKWADWQSGCVCSYTVNSNVVVSAEYFHLNGLDGDESGDQVAVQVALVL